MAVINKWYMLLGVVPFLFVSMPGMTQEEGWKQEWDQIQSAAKKEGKLVVMAGNPRSRRKLLAKFTERFGIPVEYTRVRGRKLKARLLSERRARKYTTDIYLGGIGSAYPLYLEKMFDPIRPLLIIPNVLDSSKWKKGKLWFLDPEKKYFPRLFSTVGTDIFINTDHVKPTDLQSVKDLLDSKWKGKISADDPTVAGGGSGAAAKFYLRLGEEFVKKLYIDQKPMITHDRRQLTKWLADGTYPISIEPNKRSLQRLQEKGSPLKVVLDLPDFPATIGVGGGLVALLNQAPHPNAARVFVNWIASREALEIYSRARHEPTTRNDIDESFLRAELIPRPGVDYFDSASWEFLESREKVKQLLKELLGSR